MVFADFGDRLELFPRRRSGADSARPARGGRPARATTIWCSRRRARWPRVVPVSAWRAFDLDKRLPVAAGLGGGSSDAAAALRLLARANGIARDDPRSLRGGARDRRRCAGMPRSAAAHHARHRRNDCRRRFRCRCCRRCWSIPAWRCRPRRYLPPGSLRPQSAAPLDEAALRKLRAGASCCSLSRSRRTIWSRPLWCCNPRSPKCWPTCAGLPAARSPACPARARPASAYLPPAATAAAETVLSASHPAGG